MHIFWKERRGMRSWTIVKTMLNLLTTSRSSDFESRLPLKATFVACCVHSNSEVFACV